MKAYSFIFIAIILIIGIGCQQKPAALSDAQKAEIVEQVAESQKALVKAFSDKDVKAFLDMFSSRNFLAMIKHTGDYRNYQILTDSVKINWPRRKEQHAELKMLKVYPLTTDMAIVDAIALGSIILQDGTLWKAQISWTMTWHKEPAGWYIIHCHESWKDLK